ncbi:MAG: aldo/keto reductase [Chloroflexi bacterium]|nr:aldo/keto reductase [Chloroflexota bacterium]
MSHYQASPSRYATMRYNRCGKSGLQLPAISLGLWHNFGGVDTLETARAMIWRAFDLGITHFDLANNYGPPPGSAEKNFGRILHDDLQCHPSGYTVPGVSSHSTSPIVSHTRPVVVTHRTPLVFGHSVPVSELSLRLHSGTLLVLEKRGSPDEETETIHYGCANPVRARAGAGIGSWDCPRDADQPHDGQEISHLVRSGRVRHT